MGRLSRRLLTPDDVAMPLDLHDKASGLDYFQAVTALAKLYRSGVTDETFSPSMVSPRWPSIGQISFRRRLPEAPTDRPQRIVGGMFQQCCTSYFDHYSCRRGIRFILPRQQKRDHSLTDLRYVWYYRCERGTRIPASGSCEHIFQLAVLLAICVAFDGICELQRDGSYVQALRQSWNTVRLQLHVFEIDRPFFRRRAHWAAPWSRWTNHQRLEPIQFGRFLILTPLINSTPIGSRICLSAEAVQSLRTPINL